jgi:hypothetical protein
MLYHIQIYFKKLKENYQIMLCFNENVCGKETALKVQFAVNGRPLFRYLRSACSLHTSLNPQTLLQRTRPPYRIENLLPVVATIFLKPLLPMDQHINSGLSSVQLQIMAFLVPVTPYLFVTKINAFTKSQEA